MISYINISFVSFLLNITKNSYAATSTCFKYVPKLNFKEEWNDKKPFKYFDLTEEEINLIKK